MLRDEKHTGIDKLLNEVMTAEPEYRLSISFADRMAAKVGKKYTLEQYFREFLVYLGVLAGIAVVSAGIAFVWFSADVQRWLDFLLNNISWVAGINVLIIFVLLADKVILPYLFYRTSLKKA